MNVMKLIQVGMWEEIRLHNPKPKAGEAIALVDRNKTITLTEGEATNKEIMIIKDLRMADSRRKEIMKTETKGAGKPITTTIMKEGEEGEEERKKIIETSKKRKLDMIGKEKVIIIMVDMEEEVEAVEDIVNIHVGSIKWVIKTT